VRKKKPETLHYFVTLLASLEARGAKERKTRVISQIEEVCRLDLNDYVLYSQLYNSFFFNTSLSFTLSHFFFYHSSSISAPPPSSSPSSSSNLSPCGGGGGGGGGG
jgi:uncharacterized membrane protein